MRGWFWFENVVWLRDDLDGGDATDGAVRIFLAAHDQYIDSATIHADAMDEVRHRGWRGARGRVRDERHGARRRDRTCIIIVVLLSLLWIGDWCGRKLEIRN